MSSCVAPVVRHTVTVGFTSEGACPEESRLHAPGETSILHATASFPGEPSGVIISVLNMANSRFMSEFEIGKHLDYLRLIVAHPACRDFYVVYVDGGIDNPERILVIRRVVIGVD